MEPPANPARFTAPIIVNRDGEIIDGHIVVEAAKTLGMTHVPVTQLEHLSNDECRLLRLSLNRLAETGEWDLDELRWELDDLSLAGEDLSVIGFESMELDIIRTEPIEKRSGKAKRAKEPPKVFVSRPGDVWLLGPHRVFCGDSLFAESYAAALGGQIAHAVFTDPPYNCPIEDFVGGLGQHKHKDFAMAVGEMSDEEFLDFLKVFLEHSKANLKPGGVAYACMDWRNIALLVEAGKAAGFKLINMPVWDKGAGGMGGLYRSAHEIIPVFCNGAKPATNNVELGRHGRDRTNVWKYPGANRKGSSAGKQLGSHPTPKPIELVEDALLDVTNRGDLILDPFLGSGTTIIAADISGRVAAGIEYDPAYVDVIVERWQEHSGQEAVHAETGETFAAMAPERLANPGSADSAPLN